jgi:ABC-type multidrug transport system fused ATPase/permease subunit
MQGTLKYNIDPLNLHSNTEIEDALKVIGFYYIIENDPLGLEQNVKNYK